MEDRRRPLALPFAFTVLVAPGCGAQGGTGNQLLLATDAGPNTGGLLVAFAPTDSTFEAEQARLTTDPRPTAYDVLVDGRLAMLEDGAGHAAAVTVTEGSVTERGYLNAGPHHLTIRAPAGADIFDGDGEVPGGGTVRLFLYGPLEALQGLFVATPDAPAAGNEHVTAVNLMLSGQTIEVVTCADETCAPISGALASGGVFDTEVPAGAGVGYGLVPSTSLPDPPVLAFTTGPPNIFVTAPVYISDQGQLQYGFNM
jgi:hypothetical protein